MKNGEATVSAKKTALSGVRAGAVAGLLVVAGLLPLPLDAAIDHEGSPFFGTTITIASEFPSVVAEGNEDTLDAVDDWSFALAEEVSKSSNAPRNDDVSPEPFSAVVKDSAPSVWPTKELGLSDRVQDWLARANREFQSTIIRRLSTPSAVGGDAIARKIEDVKEEDAAAAAAEAISTAQAKLAAEAEAKHQQELSDAAAKAAEQTRAREAEAARIEAARIEAARAEEQRKAADEKRQAEEQQRRDQLRIAEQEKAAKQKAAEEAAAKEAAANVAAAAKQREIAERQAAEATVAKKAVEAKEAEAKQQTAKRAEEARAAEDAKRIAAQEAAKAAAAQEAEARAKQAAARVAAEKQQAAQEAAKKDAEAKQAAGSAKQAMVEDVDKDETDVADAPSAAEQLSGKNQLPTVVPEKTSSGNADDVVREPRRHHARAHRVASNRLASRLAPNHVALNRLASNHLSAKHSATGPVVKRWVRRARQGRCRSTGNKILLPGRYTVARGDTLWLIALRHYHTGFYFRRIYRANRDILRNPNLIYTCERLYLPRR